MAVGTIIRFSAGMSADLYDTVIRTSGLQDHPPRGLIFHCAGQFEERFHVFDLWETRADFERFMEDRIWRGRLAVMDDEPVIDLPDFQVVDLAIHNIIMGRKGDETALHYPADRG
ncbi:MAG: hypothetical protein WB507_13405 [Solirubrobacterales bacterium]